MHYTSWDRGDRDRPRLLAEEGPLELAVFDAAAEKADVAGEVWELSYSKDLGATATLADGRVYRAAGKFPRDKQLKVSLNGHSFTLINENKNDWIVDDNHDHKIAQFTGAHHGVRKAILEFEGHAEDHGLDSDDVVALSWFARLALESRMEQTANALIITLVILSVAGILAFII